MCKQIFKMNIAQEMNDLMKDIMWSDRKYHGVKIETSDITDNMAKQIEHAMQEDHKTVDYTQRRKQTFNLYLELLYNDILPNKE